MNKFFFIPDILIYLFFFLIIGSFSYLNTIITFTLIFFSFLYLFLFRRHSVKHSEVTGSSGDLFLAPVHGVVKSIRKDVYYSDDSELKNEIRIWLPLRAEKGLYLPDSGEVVFLKKNKGLKVNPNSSEEKFYGYLDDISYTDMVLEMKNNRKSLIRFVDAPLSPRPIIWMKSGDRGKTSACFGYYPFGGTLIVYLPANSEILVFQGEKLKPGLSVMAVIKS